jgi:restriction system protein
MSNQPSHSSRLIAAMHHAALKALAAAPNGQLQKGALLQTIESTVPLDDWALTVYDNGNTRWRSIFAFASVGLVKGGYVTKSRGVWTITEEGRAVANAPFDGPAFLAEVNRRYQAWKSSQLTAQTSAIAQENEEEEDGEDLLAGFPEERMANILRQANEALSAELLEKIKADTDRDYWMTSEEAKAYGMVDEVLVRNPK